jgi:hypothetical protein
MEQRSILPDIPVPRTDVHIQGSWDEAIPQASRKGVNWIENKSILTPTSGFLDSGFTHNLNPYVGCSNAGSLCGLFGNVSEVDLSFQSNNPNSYRLTNNPITMSCIRIDLEKQIVLRVNRLIRVRNLRCLRSIFCVLRLPGSCSAASR